MFSGHLRRYAQEKFCRRLPFLGPAREKVLQKLSCCTDEEQVLMKFLYGTMPLRDVGEYPFSLFLCYVTHSLMLYRSMEWCKNLPEDIFLHYILYCRVNSEPIEDCRGFFYDQLIGRIQGLPPREAALEINYWCAENAAYQSTDGRTASPLTVYRCGKGRCGEESTFAVTAFRSVGIPARQVYTPWWLHCDDNHAWVEVYVHGKWHFLGACEPEETLDKGWFSNASSRALLIHARTFSDYQSPCQAPYPAPEAGNANGKEECLGQDGLMACYNRTAGYARTAFFQILVTDQRHTPVSQARLQIQVLNMAQYCQAATLYTDDQGRAGITLGLGTIRIVGRKGNCLGEAICSIKDTPAICLVLKELPGQSPLESLPASLQESPPASLQEDLPGSSWESLWDVWQDTDVEAPKEAPLHRAALTGEQKEKNQKRLDHANRLRRERIQGYYQEALASQYPGQAGILREAGGNFGEIYRFLSRDAHPDRALLLSSLSPKDYRDARADVLESHRLSCVPFREKWAKRGMLKLYADYILCPRIYLEELTDYRPYIREYFRPEGSAPYARSFSQNPPAIWDFIQTHIQYQPELDYDTICATPIGCLKMCRGSFLSQKILFAAICRTLGIPARINPVDLEAEYFAEETFIPVSKANSHSPSGKNALSAGKAILKSDSKNIWNYYQNWTIGRLDEGEVQTLDYEGISFKENRLALCLRPGSYRIITTNRLPNGNQLSSAYWFFLAAKETKEIPMRLRAGKPEEMLSANWLDDFELEKIPNEAVQGSFLGDRLETAPLKCCQENPSFRNCRKISASSLSEGKANLFAFLKAGQEPTEHLLNEMLKRADQLKEIPVQISFILPEPGDLRDQTFQGVIRQLPDARVFMGRFEEITEHLARQMYVDPEKLPLLVLTNPGLKGIYGCSGYQVGNVDLAIRILAVSQSEKHPSPG